jgi:hypothetical protein
VAPFRNLCRTQSTWSHAVTHDCDSPQLDAKARLSATQRAPSIISSAAASKPLRSFSPSKSRYRTMPRAISLRLEACAPLQASIPCFSFHSKALGTKVASSHHLQYYSAQSFPPCIAPNSCILFDRSRGVLPLQWVDTRGRFCSKHAVSGRFIASQPQLPARLTSLLCVPSKFPPTSRSRLSRRATLAQSYLGQVSDRAAMVRSSSGND